MSGHAEVTYTLDLGARTRRRREDFTAQRPNELTVPATLD